MDLYKILEDNKTDYKALSANLHFKNKYDTAPEKVDISIIVPVRGRLEFMDSVSNHLQEAIDDLRMNGIFVSLTYVEHSFISEYLGPIKTNFIWIPCAQESEFNKCLCFNMGFLHGPKADYYLFYDSDLVCKVDFLEHLILNLDEAVQTFKGRRVLYADSELTKKITHQGVMYDEFLNDKHPQISIGVPGAPGGSIMVSRDLFLKVGGYDSEMFYGYSIEDQFFFNKLMCFHTVKSLESVDLVHLYHGESHARTPKTGNR